MIGATMIVATLPVTDLDRAKVFYGGTLGLTYLWENPVSVRFRCGDVLRGSTTPTETLSAFDRARVPSLVSRSRPVESRLTSRVAADGT